MDSDRSSRLSLHFTKCSTTPRTTQRHLKELAELMEQPNRDRILYEEAKLAMSTGDTATAVVLFELLPSNYCKTREYIIKCKTYDQLCKNGILMRTEITPLQQKLGEILYEDPLHSDIVKYADAMDRNGFNVANLSATNLFVMQEAMDASNMSEGHKQLFSAFAAKNTPLCGRFWMKLLTSMEKCAPLIDCMKENKSKLVAKKNEGFQNDPSGDPKRRTEDDEATSELESLKWRAGETIFVANMMVKKNENEEDDDDDTAGDEV